MTPALRRRLLIVAAAIGLAAALLSGPILSSLVASRIRGTAAERGLTASWQRLVVRSPLQVSIRRLAVFDPALGDTLFRADSLTAGLDFWSVVQLHPRVASVGLWHGDLGLRHPAVADTDIVELDEKPPRKGEDPERLARMRRSVQGLVGLLTAPARRLPRLAVQDLAITSDRGDDALVRGARITWLELAPAAGGIKLAAVGAMLLGDEVPFELSATWRDDDRLAGGARLGLPDRERGRVDSVFVTLDGAVHQDRRHGRITIADSTRVTVGHLRFVLGGSIEREGPGAHLAFAARDLDEATVKSSLPPPVLGPLEGVGVRGSWDYRASLDLDLRRPDSVQVAADVEPHGLTLDPDRTDLNLLGLDQPFLARIHLPHGRIVERLMSADNPHFRFLDGITPELVHAVVTNEDGGFFHHRGFNVEAMKRAISENLKAGAFRRGAGTITMQLARNLYLGHERTLSRKGQEIVLAWILEHLTGLSKERLLEIYLNIIEWGPGIHGADEAANFYFGRDAGSLDLSESLFLATVVPAPSRWRGRFAPDGSLRSYARAQMHFIGRAMIAKGWLEPGALPSSDSLGVELRGAARQILMGADSLHADSLSL